MKGGGQPVAALTVGSRAVGKRKTLSAITFAASPKNVEKVSDEPERPVE
jgi:hypothetical protein